MTVTDGDAVKHDRFAASPRGIRLPAEIELDGFPSVTTLRLQAQTCCRLVTAVHHAILTTAVPRDTINNAVSVPLGFFEQLRIARIMRIRHQITGPFPSSNVTGGNGPC